MASRRNRSTNRDPFRESSHGGAKRTYSKDEDIPQIVRDIIKEATSKRTRQKEILAQIKPYVDWDENGLKYFLRKQKLSKVNLRREEQEYIKRHSRRALQEGRPIPGFELVRSGKVEKVKKSVVDRLLKDGDEYYAQDLEEQDDDDSCDIRIVGSDDQSFERHLQDLESIDMGNYGNLGGGYNFGEAGMYDTALDIDALGEPGIEIPDFEPPGMPRLCNGCPDFDWGFLELACQSPFDDDALPNPNHSTAAGQSGSFHSPPDSGCFNLRARHQENGVGHGVDPKCHYNPFGDFILQLQPARDLIQALTEGEYEQESANIGRKPLRDQRSGLGPTDPPELWSQAFVSERNKWIGLIEALSLETLTRIVMEQKSSGINDIYTCYKRVATTWRASELYFHFMDWDTVRLPPPHILYSLFKDPKSLPSEIREALAGNLVEVDVLPPDERERESRLLHKIYEDNLPQVIEISLAHKKDKHWNFGFKAITVHLKTLEEIYGPDHYLVTRVIHRFATVMERADLQNINDKDLIPLLWILIKKLFRLKLEDSYTADIPHAILHLYRSLVRVRDFQGAKQMCKHYETYCRRIGRKSDELLNMNLVMVTGMELMETERTKALRYLQRSLKFFEEKSPTVRNFIHTMGHSVISFNFLQIGRFLRGAGRVRDATSSIRSSIRHSTRTVYEMSPRVYEGVFELAVCYEVLGKPFMALTFFHDDLEYREKAGIFHTALPSLEAMSRILAKCGLSQRVQPTNRLNPVWMLHQVDLEKYYAIYDKMKASEEVNVDSEDNSATVSIVDLGVGTIPE
ncbi:hypothetical protein TWF730_000303 [Orbilia blumenaviensis]|uniref:Uncharacterized protein n=1 Tax=Orbilia blumenaviensis TaxID=1796055 RepID=A0AAV9VN93_9PEZI